MLGDFPKLIQDSTVKLAQVTVDDVSQRYVDWLNDHYNMRFTDQCFKVHDHASTVEYVKGMLRSTTNILYCILVDDIHIGNIKLGALNVQHKHAEIAYFLGDSKYTGKGLATKAVGLLCANAFQYLDLRKLTAGYITENVGSAKVLEKNGFQIEGIFREHFYRNERYYDVVRVAKFNPMTLHS